MQGLWKLQLQSRAYLFILNGCIVNLPDTIVRDAISSHMNVSGTPNYSYIIAREYLCRHVPGKLTSGEYTWIFNLVSVKPMKLLEIRWVFLEIVLACREKAPLRLKIECISGYKWCAIRSAYIRLVKRDSNYTFSNSIKHNRHRHRPTIDSIDRLDLSPSHTSARRYCKQVSSN